MTPLHTPPVTPHYTSHAPLAPSQNDAELIIQHWVENAPPGEGRTQAAYKIRDAYQTNAAYLDLSNFGALTTLPPLPAGLTTLSLVNCYALRALPDLPEGLTTLNLVSCHALTTLHLPAELTTLTLADCRTLTTPPLPAGLTTLTLARCHTLITPPNLPAGLTTLEMIDCQALTTLPENLPGGLTTLNIVGCRALMTLPHNLPAGLTRLDISDCHALANLPEHLPAGLIMLNISGCRALTAMPGTLPPHVVIYGYQPVPPTPTHPLAQWCLRAEKPPAYVANLNHEWQQLKTTAGARFEPFETLIARLAHPSLLNSIPPIAVLEIIEAVIQSPELRHLIFEASAEAAADCHDRPLTIFNTVQGLAQFGKLQREGAAPQAILQLAIGMAKLALLDEATCQVMQKQWQEQRRTGNTEGTGPNMEEALEVQLALRHQLGGELGLPFLVNHPLYATNSAQLTDADRAFATAYVNDALSNTERLIDALVAQPIWRLHLEPTIPAETLSAINNHYAERQNALEEQCANRSINDHDFIHAVDALRAERQVALDAPFKQKTAELLG